MSSAREWSWVSAVFLLLPVIGCEGPPQLDPTAEGGQPTPASGVVGRVEASFDVGSAGNAAYTIPIKVPPGTLGVQPRISVSYNSQAGNGLLGTGFTLQGLSEIKRCEQTMVRDGTIRAVAFDTNDRFCMDGLRLVAISGAYGEDGSVYMTESQTWSRVESVGVCTDDVTLPHLAEPVKLGGPCSFDVTLKNGTRVEFGGADLASCSHYGSESNARLFWPMTRLSDLHGNTIEIKYRNGGLNSCVPDTIEYSSNPLQNAPALRKIEFDYMDRQDVVRTYRGGVAFDLRVLLETIRTFVRSETDPTQETLVKRYDFGYGFGSAIDYSPFTDRAQLNWVRECDGTGSCLPITKFGWSAGDWMEGTRIVQIDGIHTAPWTGHPLVVQGDFDGNGLMDYVAMPTPNDSWGTQYLAREPGGNDFQARQWIDQDIAAQGYYYPRFQTGDIDGDGFTDVFWFTDQGWRVFRGGPDGLPTDLAHLNGGAPTYADRVFVGDFTGDGRTDLFALVGAGGGCSGTEFDGWRVYPSVGNGFDSPQSGDFSQGDFPILWHVCGGLPDRITFNMADFNGDGRVDFLTTKRLADDTSGQMEYRGWRLYLSDGTSFHEEASGVWPYADLTITPGDFNGDGLTDVVLTGDGVTSQPGYVLLRGTGRTLEPVLNSTQIHTVDLQGGSGPYQMTWGSTGGLPDYRDVLEVANFNDDGLDDLLVTSANVYQEEYDGARLYASRGDRFDHKGTRIKSKDRQHLTGTFQGHGLTGYFVSYSNQLYYYLYKSDKPDLLTTIVDGVKSKINIEYEPMTALGQYTKGSGAQYPTRDMASNRYVASEIYKYNGNGEFLHTKYYYEGAKTDLAGRGFLGFERITARHSNPHRTVITEYHTDLPKAGSVKSQEVRVGYPSDHRIAKTEFQYQDLVHQQYPGVHNVVMSSERTTDYTVDGQPVLTRGKDYYYYDGFGNVSRVVDRGDVNDDEFDLWTRTIYHNDVDLWRIGFPSETVVYQDLANPLRRKKVTYNDVMDVVFEGEWDDTNGIWLGNEYDYDAFGNRNWTRDPLGSVTTVEFDGYGFPRRTTNQLGHKVTTVHDPAFGLEVSRTDANNNVTVTLHDGLGRTSEIKALNPEGKLVTVRWFRTTSPGFGWVTQSFVRRHWASSTNPEWDWTEELRDGWGRIYRQRRRGQGSSAIVTDREYKGFDVVRRVSRPYFEGDSPLWIDYVFDAKKRLAQVTYPSGQTSQTVYDDVNRTVTKVDPNGQTTELRLDPRGKLLEKIDPMGGRIYYAHDVLGRRTRLSSPASFYTTVEYDSLGRKVLLNDSSTGTVTFVYDSSGQLEREVDGAGRVISRTYDGLGRTTQKFYRPGEEEAPTRWELFEYDQPAMTHSTGQLTGVTSYRGKTVESSYSYSYDAQGHQTQALLELDGRSFTWSESFDPAGNVVQRTYPDGSLAEVSFSSAGFLQAIQLDDSGTPNQLETYADYRDFDAEGRPSWLVFKNDVVTCYEYDAPAARLRRTVTAHYSSSPQNPCLDDLAFFDDETRYLEYTYEWDDVNNITEIKDHLVPVRTQTFEYNDRGDLTRAEGVYGVHIYSYSLGGNRVSKDGVAYTYSLQKVVSSSAGLVVTYDSAGNVSTKTDGTSNWTFDWDVDDLLLSVTKDNLETRFAYDYAGNRLRKRDPDGTINYYASSAYEVMVASDGTEVHTKYLEGPSGRLAQVSRQGVNLAMIAPADYYAAVAAMYDRGSLLHLRFAVLSLLHSPGLERGLRLGLLAIVGLWCLALLVRLLMGSRIGSPTQYTARSPRFAKMTPVVLFVLMATYGVGDSQATMTPGPNGPGRPFKDLRFIHSNQVGSSVLLTDGSGMEVSRVEYEPYGAVYQPQSSGSDEFRPKFAGKEWDADTGLYYFGARYYDPSFARFLSGDRTAGAGELKTVALNRYAYAQNNPITYSDPSGRYVELLVGMVIGAIVGALLLGTEGKILRDPSHAFDNWSWSRALMGAWLGMIVAGVTFGLGTIGTTGLTSGVELFGAKIGTLAANTFVGGVLSAALEYGSGETDAARLAAYFGIGLALAFVSGTNVLGAVRGRASKIARETLKAYANSFLKHSVNPDKPLQINIWIYKITIDKNNKRKYDTDEAFFLTQVATLFINVGFLDADSVDRVKKGWNWESMSIELVEPARLGFLEQFTGLLPSSYPSTDAPKMTGVLSSMAKNMFHAATGPCTGDACGFYDDVVRKMGVDGGIGTIGKADSALSQWAREEMSEYY